MNKETLIQARDWGLLNSLLGKTFCFTGTMSIKRTELEWIIGLLGGYVSNAVTSTTDYLIIPDVDVKRSSKFKAAQERGTSIITEEHFCAMILPSVEQLLVKN